MIKINQNEKDEIQAWISMLFSRDLEAWMLAKSLILSSSFYKRNQGPLSTLYFICDDPNRSIYFINAIDYIEDCRWELIEILSELIDKKQYTGYLVNAEIIDIEYENN